MSRETNYDRDYEPEDIEFEFDGGDQYEDDEPTCLNDEFVESRPFWTDFEEQS